MLAMLRDVCMDREQKQYFSGQFVGHKLNYIYVAGHEM